MSREHRRIQFSKYLDARLGPLILRLMDLFSRRKGPPRPAGAVRSILFVKFWGLGSIVLTEPALRALRARYPNASVDYLTLERNRQLFELIPGVRHVWTLQMNGVLRFVWEATRLSLKLRKQPYDLVFDAEFFSNTSAILAVASGASEIVGFAHSESPKRRLLNRLVPFDESSHASRQFAALVGPGPALMRPVLARPETGSQPSLSELGSGPYVVLNINSSALALERRWPRRRFAKLARALLDRHPYQLVLIGTKAESHYVAPLVQQLGDRNRVVDATGRLTIVGLADLLSRAQLLVSNDSGPIHLGAAVGVPVVGLYGPETPRRYGPLTDHGVVLYRDLWCSPCMSLDNAKTVHCVNETACMKDIQVSDVLAAVAQLLPGGCFLPVLPHVASRASQ